MTRTGRSGKLTTGNINPCIMHGLIFCFRVGGQAIFLEPEGRDGCDCRVVSRSDADGAGPLSQPFLRTFGMDRRVRPTYSKTMGRAYPALACPKCGGVQEDNFIYRNYRNRGGVFSNPADRSPLGVPPLPVCADDRPRECRWVFDGSSLGVEAFTVIRPDVERTISRSA